MCVGGGPETQSQAPKSVIAKLKSDLGRSGEECAGVYE